MPLIMDGAMDAMDALGTLDTLDTLDTMTATMPVELDLFGDPVLGDTVALALPTSTPSKQLQQRIDSLRSRGCCQAVAWSRQGTIASIGADGRSVDLQFLRTHPKDGSWSLSEQTPCTLFGTSFQGGPIVHLAWAATGSPELAIIDAVGRISLLTFSMSLNRPYQLRPWDADPVDDLYAVVGCYWLPLTPQSKQYNVIHGPAVREGNGYKYESTYTHAFGPYHPNPAKSALVCVTTNGFLKLFFSQNNNKMHDTSLELESITTSDDLITHASICSERSNPSGMLHVALATAAKQLRIMRVAIHWGSPQADKQVPPGSTPLSPTLQTRPVAVTSWLQHDASESLLDTTMPQLSHLEILPSAAETPNGPWSPPLVLAVRSHIPISASSFNQELQSIIDRWEILNEQSQTPHPAFEQLGSRSGHNSNTQTTARLRKMDSVVINKIIVAIHPTQFGKIICIAFSDGTVQYRDRFSFNEIYHEINVNRIMTLHQVGFKFPDSVPCLQVAFSPTNCSFVQICEDGKVKWNGLRYPVPDIGSTTQDREYSAIVAGLTTAVSTASFHQISYDDVLATARQFADKPRFAYDWMMEIVRMMKINVDYSEDAHHDQLVRNASLQLCLSILNHMGFRGEFEPKAFCGKFALLALNVRNIVILVTIASNTPITLKEKLSPLDEPEVVDALAGCSKWALDLLAYLTDSLFNLLDDPKFMGLLNATHWSELVSYLQSQNEVALHLLLCSSTRGFLSAACRRLIHLESLSNRAIAYYESRASQDPNTGSRGPSALSAAYQKMQHYTSSSLIKVQEFDKLLSTLGADIRSAYSTSLARLAQNAVAQASAAKGGSQGQGQAEQARDAAIKRAQSHCELTMLLANSPPLSFLPVITKFFTQDLRAFKAVTDPSKLFFASYAILEVEDDDRSLAAKRARGAYVDVFKRVELTAPKTAALVGGGAGGQGALWRRCVRCAAIMEDVLGHRPGITFVLAQQRKCSCGGNWGLLPRGSLVS